MRRNMAEDDAETKRNRKIDMIYKNLEHVSKAYSTAEGVFPYWETVFALIIGQLFIAYFESPCYDQKMWLAILGLILSFIWFILVSLNYQNALHIGRKAEYLEDQLQTELDKDIATPLRDFVVAWPRSIDRDKWTLTSIILGWPPNERGSFSKALKSTWFWRRSLAVTLFLAWSFLISCVFFLLILFLILVFLNIVLDTYVYSEVASCT